ncbi:hypothetical protein [Clostridium saccharobutylicum]|uniref:Uncharacterized protein n=1 Tax=Clostridium saccharobutylicum DSM 13864 TaxID=1345695 RepID=U5MWY0_CLOSA|nr:hypothetical protein [Clostridium saccharobutylicum]AGX44141.1 hypothetical protein CLSA_c31750 [Clostridium saccharobutylicum DSM 13864]AQR91429.1 hypothetical protein CLOSC_31540 [Clostridium saccharobutylicum]AQS01333.1 hypothetical protein CSACC_31610 [Clostridium saccharobutylicum]AQS10943.1 hypothetical protein CLOBY_30920 [Clostridium saccharobutylicum]AQS15316.1 hypothetical protein CLOSACC_31610 [Clostridium saccharobutylicum]
MNKIVECGRRIYGCISTYDSLLTRGSVVISIVEEFVDSIVKPINKELRYSINLNKKKYKYETSDWEKTKILINKGKVEKISFVHFDEKMIEAKMKGIDCPEAYTPPELININILSNNENAKRASLIEFSVNKWTCAKNNSQHVCLEYQKLIEMVLSNIDCVGGFITLDCVGAYSSFSAHERYIGLDYMNASEKFDKYFRGYSWGNYLSKKHVELLGGIEKIKKEAPVYLVKKLSDDGAYLQLTKEIDEVSDEDLRKLKKYFQPILPKASRMLFSSEAKYRRMIIDDDDELIYLENKK